MREDYQKSDQRKIERFYAERRMHAKPKDASVHGHGCTCKSCYEEWAWSTGFETMNPEGRKRQATRDKKLGVKTKSG